MKTQRITPAVALALVLAAGAAAAKLPPPSEEAKAKAAEAADKAAHGNKVAAYQLCKSMDKVAADYYAQARRDGKETKLAVQTPACTDPGPYAPAKPLETAGAHSQPGGPATAAKK